MAVINHYPNEVQLEELSKIPGYVLPAKAQDVYWFMISSGSPMTVKFLWISHEEKDEYLKDYICIGMSVKGLYPHYMPEKS